MSIDYEMPPVEPVHRDWWQRLSAATGHPHQLPATLRPARRSKGTIEDDRFLGVDSSCDRVQCNRVDTQMTPTGCSRKLIGKKLEVTVVLTSYPPAQFPRRRCQTTRWKACSESARRSPVPGNRESTTSAAATNAVTSARSGAPRSAAAAVRPANSSTRNARSATSQNDGETNLQPTAVAIVCQHSSQSSQTRNTGTRARRRTCWGSWDQSRSPTSRLRVRSAVITIAPQPCSIA